MALITNAYSTVQEKRQFWIYKLCELNSLDDCIQKNIRKKKKKTSNIKPADPQISHLVKEIIEP